MVTSSPARGSRSAAIRSSRTATASKQSSRAGRKLMPSGYLCVSLAIPRQRGVTWTAQE